MVCHRFPNPRNDLERLKRWIEIVGGLDNLDPNSVCSKKFICVLHFTNDCSSPGTKKLNAHAYPTINLPNRAIVNLDVLNENVQPTGIYTIIY